MHKSRRAVLETGFWPLLSSVLSLLDIPPLLLFHQNWSRVQTLAMFSSLTNITNVASYSVLIFLMFCVVLNCRS